MWARISSASRVFGGFMSVYTNCFSFFGEGCGIEGLRFRCMSVLETSRSGTLDSVHPAP